MDNWYALKVFYGKVLHVKDLAEKDGVETYVAMTTLDHKVNGRITHITKPLVPSLMFIKCTEDFLKSFREKHSSELTYYKTAISKDSNHKHYKPAVIPDDQMEVFRRATTEGGSICYLGDLQSVNLKPGDRVRVVEGDFKGTEGYLKRIKKDRKFIISIGSIAAFTIEGITYKMVEKIESQG